MFYYLNKLSCIENKPHINSLLYYQQCLCFQCDIILVHTLFGSIINDSLEVLTVKYAQLYKPQALVLGKSEYKSKIGSTPQWRDDGGCVRVLWLGGRLVFAVLWPSAACNHEYYEYATLRSDKKFQRCGSLGGTPARRTSSLTYKTIYVESHIHHMQEPPYSMVSKHVTGSTGDPY